MGAAKGMGAAKSMGAAKGTGALVSVWISRWLTMPAVHWIALLGLCAAYLQGAFDKLIDFSGALAETQHFGIEPALPFTVATIVTEIVGPILILSGFLRWVGALWLAGFTLIATFIANRFWEIPLPGRLMVENGFFEHLGLVGGFILVAWHDLARRVGRA
jgi:uncharacterized membrane protein YphA (DoxX/SURF4 family)